MPQIETNNNIKYAFFGSSRFSVIVLDEMKRRGRVPSLIVTTPDKPQGRKLTITPNVVKVWAEENKVPFLSPIKLNAEVVTKLKEQSEKLGIVLFVVASYGKIIPKSVLDIPARKALNIHPSLLPAYRGASPLQSAMLADDKNTGVTIIRLDEEMDHGPIVAKENITIDTWLPYEAFEAFMAKIGAELLVTTMPNWVNGNILKAEQLHSKATYTKKITKKDAQIDLRDDPYLNFRKIQAYHESPVAYFMHKHNGKEIRVKITSASFIDGNLVIEKVIPEGSKEISYTDFLHGFKDNTQE